MPPINSSTFSFLLGLVFLSLLTPLQSVCHSYATRCSAEVGNTLTPEDSKEDVFEVPATDSLYFHFSPPRSDVGTRVLASVLYGNVEIYAAVGRKATSTDFDFRTDSFQGVLMLPPLSTDSVVDVIISAVTNSKLRAMVNAHSVTSVLSLGMPQLDCLMVMPSMSTMEDSSVTHTYTFEPKSTNKHHVVLSPFAETDPNIVVNGPQTSGKRRSWSSSEYGSDSIVLVPTEAEIDGRFEIVISISSLFNQTLYTILVSETSVDSPTTLLGGVPVEYFASEGEDLNYVLDVPKSSGDITFMVTPIHGDPDLYVNPVDKGFYVTPADIKDKVPSVWDSDHSFGTDSVLVSPDDPEYIRSGSNFQYLITVHANSNTRFAIRAYSASTVMTLTAGTPVIDSVSEYSYHYYRFVEAADSTSDVIFDVSPLEGDPDLLVGCRLYPLFNSSGFPSRLAHHHNYSSGAMGEDSILVSGSRANPRKCPSGVYYLAVFGYHKTRFSLSAIHQGGVVKLLDGVTARSTNYPGIGRHFSFRMGVEAEALSITLTPFDNDCDLYVKNGDSASKLSYDYKSALSGVAADQVVIPERDICTKCDIGILVWGRQKCSFSIVASLEDTTIQLSQAVPMQESVEKHKIQYYTLQSYVNGTGVVVVTVFTGDPKIFLSTTVEQPSNKTRDTITSQNGVDGGVPVAYIDVREHETLYIGVGGGGQDATYTVRAHTEEKGSIPLLHLLPAVPQVDEILAGDPSWTFYQVNAPIGHEAIIFRASAFVGDVDVYVQHCPYQGDRCRGGEDILSSDGTVVSKSKSYLPNRTYYSYASVGLNKDFITMQRNDANASSYIVGVVSNTMNSEYQVSMNMKNSILMLSPGSPVTDYTSKGEYDYFALHVDAGGEELTFDVMPYSGDVDLFISTSQDVVNENIDGKPNATFFTWRSAKFGEDSITIDTELDPKACSDCTYYLSVYGYTASQYTVSVSAESTVGRLLDGVIVRGSVPFLGAKMYSYKNTHGIGRDFKIRINVLSGNPMVYITFNGSTPTLSNHALSSPLFSSNTITISIRHNEDYYEPCLAGECRIRIAVVGLLSSSYTISITSSRANTLLQMNVPVHAEVARHEYDYFMTTLPSHTSNLRLTLTEYSGFAVMYVSCHHPYPNGTGVGFTEWEFYPFETNHFDVSALEASSSDCPSSGEFYMSVYGDSSCTYSIMASVLTNTSVPKLYTGISMTESVAYQAFKYYYYLPPSDFAQDATVLVTVTQGDVEVFVSAGWADRPYYSDVSGKVESYQLRSATTGSPNVHIKHSEMEEMCLQQDAHDRVEGHVNVDDCYIVIGVMGTYESSESESSYRIEMSTEDSTTILSSGVAVRGSLFKQTMDYYKYSVTAPDTDIVVSLTPFYGDPDMFLSLEPVIHPGPTNFTWMAANFGADTLNIQADELSQHCTPQPATGKHCDIYIAVYAWKNTSYSVVARMEEGSKHPVVLTDGQPQSGSVETGFYSYYSFYIQSHDEESVSLPNSVTITVTASDGGDQDVYVILGGDSEPGKTNFQYASVNYEGLMDQVIISSTDTHYCSDCNVLIAVYGYHGGEFTITATSASVAELMSGKAVAGHVMRNSYVYYSIHNSNPAAEISISLTSISGDPDLFMNVYNPSSSSEQYNYPTLSHYTWRSINSGSDGISLNYADPDFCYECSYIVGVYAAQNSTYTLMVTDSEDAVVTLSRNRPQRVTLPQDGVRYFMTHSASSTEDITVSVTVIGSGSVKIYMEKYPASTFNSTARPNPIDPSSYSYSNLHSHEEFVHAPGPNAVEVVYVVLVTSTAPITYDVILSSSDTPVLLRAGTPQSHFVKQNSMEYFRFSMHALTDLQVSISATSGDPDLFIYMGEYFPECHVQQGSSIFCKNWTWASTTYDTDQVIISQDYPCEPLLPGTLVMKSCRAKDFHAGEVHIGVYGYVDSKFHIMATPRGQHIQLLPGHRQLAYTAPGFLCPSRSENGACLSTEDDSSMAVEVAYFKFEFSGSDHQSVLFTVVPTCPVSRNTTTPCLPGCDCDMLRMVIKSCISSDCTTSSKYPTPSNPESFQELKQVGKSGTSVLVDDSSPALCTVPPGSSDVCVYYVAVFSPQSSQSVAFTVDIETSNDLSVISCESTPSPDGLRISHSSAMSSSHNDAKYFELCSGADSVERMIVTLEECFGSAEVYACSDASSANVCSNYLPSESSWDYYANEDMSCDHSNHGRKTCSNNVDTVSQRIPTLDFPEKNGNYYLKVNGTGQFNLNVQNTVGGSKMSPSLMFDAVDQSGHDAVQLKPQGKASLTLSWQHAKVLMPGAETVTDANHMSYSLYIFPVENTKSSEGFVFDTPCGLEYSAKQLKAVIRPVTLIGGSKVTYSLDVSEFPLNTEFTIVVMATCDSDCLRQVSKVTPRASMTCNDPVGCKAQHLIYQSVGYSTPKDQSSSGGGIVSWFSYMFFVSILVITAVSATLFGVFSFYYQNKSKLDELQSLEMTDYAADHSSSPSNMKVASDLPGRASRGRSVTTRESFMGWISDGARSFGEFLSSLSSSSAPASFNELDTSSSHMLSAYDPPTATDGRGLLSTVSSSSRGDSDYVEEDDEGDDEITVNL